MEKLRQSMRAGPSSSPQPGPSQQPGSPPPQPGPSQQPDIVQQSSVPQYLNLTQPHYSPISDPEGSVSTPEPFNMPLIRQEDIIGARLANPNDSPIHSCK